MIEPDADGWTRFALEDGQVLALYPAVPAGELAIGQALLVPDDPDQFELCDFVDVVARVADAATGAIVAAFVHPDDLARFAAFMKPRGRLPH
jgi:hypothetical protein